MARDGRRSVQIEDATKALITVGDNSPITVTRADAPIFALQPLQQAPPVPPRGGPARLLNSRYELVEFVGQDQSVAYAVEWLDTDASSAARLITGAGGQGKTRFSIHLGRLAANTGWIVLFGRHKMDGALLPVDSEEPDTTLDGDCSASRTLVIIDYAERWPRNDLLELFRRVDVGGGRVRFLLLARSDWFWPTLARTLDAVGISVSHDALPAVSDVDDRAKMHLVARHAFTKELYPAQSWNESGQLAPPSPSFSSPLAIQMSALVDVLRVREGEWDQENEGAPPVHDATALTRELLVREVQHWMGLRTASPPPISISDRDMACAVAVGTLTKGLAPESALTLLPTLNLDASARTIVHDHGVPYPPTTALRVLEPLLPDRLAEDFLASFLPGPKYPKDELLRLLCDPFAPSLVRTVVTSESPDRDGKYPLVVLIEAARRWTHVADFLFELLQDDPGKLLGYGGDAIARAAPIAALRALLPRLAEAIDNVVGVRQHIDLDMAALVVQEQIVEIAREESTEPSPHLASTLNILAIRRLRVGQHDAASTAAEESVGLWRHLLKDDAKEYSIELARALGNLAATRAELGDFRVALEHSERELYLTREANRVSEGNHRSELAGLLANRANYLAAVGQYGGALALARESVALHEALLRSDREGHLANAAAALEGYGRILHHLGDSLDATACFRRAVEIRRELAGMDPAAHISTLASSLTNLAISLHGLTPSDGLEIAEESVRLFRDLHHKS